MPDWAHWVEIGILALAGGNLFFIRRLVTKLDEASNGIIQMRAEMSNWRQQIKHIEDKIVLLFKHVDEISDLKRDVAVLQTIMDAVKKTLERS